MANNKYKKVVEFGQDIYDLCIQEYGSLSALFLMLADNPSLDLKRELVAGELVVFRIEVPKNIPLNKNLMDFYRTKQIRVNNKDGKPLKDYCLVLTAQGNQILTANLVRIALQNCKATSAPTSLVGIKTSTGAVIATANGNIIRPITAATLANSKGFSILTSTGNEIKIVPKKLNYILTAQGNYILTAQSNFIITS